MTKALFYEKNQIDDDVVCIEPWDDYVNAIIGMSENHRHIFYDYIKLVEITAKSFRDEYYKQNHSNEEVAPDFDFDAAEWVDCNMSFGDFTEDKQPIVILPCVIS